MPLRERAREALRQSAQRLPAALINLGACLVMIGKMALVGEKRSVTIGGHMFCILATEQVGCDSGRRRYRVECHTCELVVS